MTDISEQQRRRAENIIWNAARSHAFTPDFKAYDSDCRADLYWNTIIGACRKHFDYPKFEAVFRSFETDEDADLYESLLWLGLENAVFEKERGERPVLERLRREYAEKYLASFRQTRDLPLGEAVSYAHFSRAAGHEPHLDRYDEKLLEDLEFSASMTTDEIVDAMHSLLERWFLIRIGERKEEKKAARKLFGIRSGKQTKGRLRKFGLGFADRPSRLYGGSLTGRQDADPQRITSLSAKELREFMEAKFGKSIFNENETKELERTVCSGDHAACHVLITAGEKGTAAIRNGFEALQREREAAQVIRNRAYYSDNRAVRRTAVDRLSARIMNSVLLHLQPSPIRSDTGKLDAGRVWRGVRLDDDRVFIRDEQSNMGDLSVDILLDASTSQNSRQAIVSNQGYIIAESLNRCNIPCRVMSFCSMTGYTILRIFRGYNERGANDRIFDYVSNGCNRDGFAIRLARTLIAKESYAHRILIVLSDVKPNDVVRIKQKESGEFVNYERMAAIRDTAFEVRAAKAEGISVICAFTGDDEDVASARLIYESDFVRIRSLEEFADTVGKLLQAQIRNM